MNWRRFREYWHFRVWRYLLIVCCPWFAIHISSGACEVGRYTRWYGIRLYWSHPLRWDVEEGGLMFRKGDPFLSTIQKQVTKFG
jgi:hypothetical protein